jgi:hypothetical protein
MRWSEIVGRKVTKRKPLAEDAPVGKDRAIDGVPKAISDPFFRGLDDAMQGRTMSVDVTLAEGRRRIAAYRKKQNQSADTIVDDPNNARSK